MKRKLRLIALFQFFFPMLMLIGCSLGPHILKQGHLGYNSSVKASADYMLSDKFTALQEKLGQFLGEAWVLEDAEVQAQAIAEAQKQIDAQGMKILGMVTFKNVEKPSNMVMLMQMALPSAPEGVDEQAMVTLTHLDM